MAKYQKYAEYKDSGVVWLGEIPSHWIASKIGFHALKIGSGKTPRGGAEIYADEGVLFLRSQNIYNDGLKIDNSESVYITQTIHEDMSTSKVHSGDILLNITGGSIGRSCLVPPNFTEANVNQHVCIIRVRDHLNEFLALVIKADLIQAQIRLIQTGGNREGLNFEQIAKFIFMLPPPEEQKLIISFLNHETAKIDTLIAKQEKLIELLKEKRQAVISHAVTKGLNPNVPMKDSGVEWLGEVPEHWIVKRLKHISPKIGVGLVINPSTYTREEGVYFIFGGDVKEYEFDLSKTRRISKHDSDNLLPSRLNHRDLVSIRVGYPGVTAVVTKELEGANCASIIVIRRGKYNSDWLCAAMNIWVGRQQVELASYGAAQKQFNVSDALEFKFPVPPANEQDEIARFVEETRKKFDNLSNKALQQIELLKERRTALISAAVTGKIDVRNWQNPNKNNNQDNMELSA